MGQASLIIGRERRRRFTEEQKFELMTAAFGAGGNVAEVARRADIGTSLLYRWRQAHLATQTPAFVPAVVRDEDQTGSLRVSGSPAAIIVELARGGTVRITAAAPAALVEATLRALR
jgi:transposase